MSAQHELDVLAGTRFEFGKNWSRFISDLDDNRIRQAEQSLRDQLGVPDLRGARFLDVGSGSGLFSLAAHRLGATVKSFDYDPHSVACTAELRRHYVADDSMWSIEQGSILDRKYCDQLGTFDVVYSWGVLHHTGNMALALENVARLVAPRGKLWIAIYNDQGRASKRWLAVKTAYNRAPPGLRWLVLAAAAVRLWSGTVARDALSGDPLRTWRNYPSESRRGMSAARDLVDWVGGLPFEVSTPERILQCFRDRGFELAGLKTCGGGLGCNEFVFERSRRLSDSPRPLPEHAASRSTVD